MKDLIFNFIYRFSLLLLYSFVPILFVFNANFDMVLPSHIVRPLVIASIFTLLLFLFLSFLIRDKEKSFVVSQFTLLFIFFYFPTDDYVLVPYLLIYALLIFAVIKRLINFTKISQFLVRVFLILFIFNSYQFVWNTIQARTRHVPEKVSTNLNLSTATLGYKPDIYLIVLDGYARSDVLKEVYSYDWTPFGNYLQDKGFYVNANATSNYVQTYLSMFSLFQMNYLDMAKEGLQKNDVTRLPLLRGIINSPTVAYLNDQDYTFVIFNSGWAGSAVLNKIGHKNIVKSNITEVEMVLLNSTFLASIKNKAIPYYIHANRVNNVFDELPEIAKNPEATFTYAHILSPHPPFVFDEKGKIRSENRFFTFHDSELKLMNLISQDDYKKKYIEQMSYVNNRLQVVIDDILENSEKPPIIYIVSDHGPASEFTYYDVSDTGIYERFSNLNAVYFPDKKYEDFETVHSPVNMFRVMFNRYFNANLPFVIDGTKRTSAWYSPYDFTDVTERYETIYNNLRQSKVISK